MRRLFPFGLVLSALCLLTAMARAELLWYGDPDKGWYAQSNSVNVGDTNFWFVIPGSELATNLVITVDPLKTNVLYRLSNP